MKGEIDTFFIDVGYKVSIVSKYINYFYFLEKWGAKQLNFAVLFTKYISKLFFCFLFAVPFKR